MNAKQVSHMAYDTTDRVAEHAITRITARLAMIVAPVLIGFFWNDVTETINGVENNTRLLSTQQLVLQNTVNSLERSLDSRTSDRYTGTQAARDWAAQNARDNRQDADRDRIEQRLNRIR